VLLRRVFMSVCAGAAVGCANGSEPRTIEASDLASVPATIQAPRPIGLIYAEAACGACHAVAAGQTRSPNTKAPAFQVIADTPGMTPMALNVWLHSPIHRDMPYVLVAADQLDPLVEYVYSLRR
jgi:hypothetical protein